jgi:Rrf2 family protein
LIITRATEHSITAMLHLASKHPTPVVSKRDICEAEGITPAFLTKILQPLIRMGLVNSKRGVAGGFQLAKNPEELTIWDVMQAVEEPLALNVCLSNDEECGRSNYCPVHCLWLEMKDEMKRIFSSKSLAQLARERAEQGPGPLTCPEPGCKK